MGSLRRCARRYRLSPILASALNRYRADSSSTPLAPPLSSSWSADLRHRMVESPGLQPPDHRHRLSHILGRAICLIGRPETMPLYRARILTLHCKDFPSDFRQFLRRRRRELVVLPLFSLRAFGPSAAPLPAPPPPEFPAWQVSVAHRTKHRAAWPLSPDR